MNNFIFKLLIFFILYPELLLTCSKEYSDCFNCSSCGTRKLISCPCQWNYNTHSCNNIISIILNNNISETFSQCIDDQSSSIQNKYCGESKIIINKEYFYALSKINNKYGTKSLYCSYEFILVNNNKSSYHINISNNKQNHDRTQLYFNVIHKDLASKNIIIRGNENITNYNEYFDNVKTMKLNIYFEKGYDYLPFSITIEEINELHQKNNNNTLIIILSVVITFFIFSGIFCFFVKKYSQKERQRQHALFERELARYNGEGDEDEIYQRKKIEKINRLKIKYILDNSLIKKNFNKLQILKEKKICSICIERIKLKSKISITTCNHIFHYKCLSTWLYKNIMEPKCPNCQLNLINGMNDDIIIVNTQKYRHTNENEEINSVRNNQENNVLRLNNNNQSDKNSNSKESFQSRNTISKISNRTQNSKTKEIKTIQVANSTV